MKKSLQWSKRHKENDGPIVIAEMSGNHNQSLDRALAIVDKAAAAGAHAFKIQTYTADTMTLDLSTGEFYIRDPKSLWKSNSLYNLYKQAYTPWEWHKAIFDRCKKNGMIGFSSPFDATAVDFLESLNVSVYKIASFENIDIPLIRKVAATGKPMIISTGMATIAELDEAVRGARSGGCKDLTLLKCTSAYPCPEDEVNLASLPHLKSLFNCPVGLSDHTIGIGVSLGAVALGATVLERHFTLARADGGVDSAFSLEPAELSMLVEESRKVALGVGQVAYGPTEREKKSLQYRRSLYITRDIRKGDRLSSANVRAIRPGLGLSPKYMDMVLGKTVSRNAKKGTPVSWNLL
jgi:pseudaminic acid synthase